MIVTSNMSDDEERFRSDEVDPIQPDMLTAWEKYQEFELCLYDKDDHDSRSQFIAEWKERMCSALACGCQFSESVLAFKLLEKSALGFDQVNAILRKLRPHDNILSQTISKILKVCGEQDVYGKMKGKTKKTQNKRNTNTLSDDEDYKPADVIKKRPKSKTEHKCNICLKSFCTPSYLRAHIAMHDRKPLKEHACPYCHARFRHEKGIQAHLKRSRCRGLIENSPDVEKEQSVVVEQSSVWLKGEGDDEDGGEEEMDNADDEHDVVEYNGDPNQHDYVQHPVKYDLVDVDATTMEVKRSETIIESIEMKPVIEVNPIQVSLDSKEKPKKAPGTKNFPRSEVECPICQKMHTFPSQLRDHMVVHFDKRDFTCEICGAMLRRKRDLKRHMMKKTCSKRIRSIDDPSEMVKKFECEMCRKRFTHNFLLRAHIRAHTGERPYQCTFCTEAFATSKELFKHNRTHPEATYYTCKECERDYMTIHTYKHHRVKHHGETDGEIDIQGDFQCPNCTMHFTSSLAYESHRKLHGLISPFQCDICGKVSTSKHGLKVHRLTHTGEKPYKCFICNKAFCQASGLQSHFRTHSGEKPYKCDECGRCFAIKKTLIVHTRTHTKERPFACEECGKAFAHPHVLKKHMRSHTGEKPFMCTICSKAYSRPDILKEHMKSHKENEDGSQRKEKEEKRKKKKKVADPLQCV